MEEKKELKVIDVIKIAKKLWLNKKLFAKTLPIAFVVTSIYIMGFPCNYTTDIKLAPELGGGGSLSSTLGSLTSSFRFDLDNFQTNDAITPLLYPDLMEDNGFVASLFNVQVKSEDGSILIGGRGPETERLKAANNSGRIKFIGRIPNEYLRYYYYASDIFAFTSCTKQEAFGIALAEAMYRGSVPVTFTIEGSGVNWVSVKDETGIEVPLGDIKAYAEAIDKLLNDKELYMKYAAAGKDRIARMFTSEHSNVQAKEVLTQLITKAYH